MACGWWSEMEHNTYKDEAAVKADQRSIDFLREAGVDWVSDSHPWGGETARMNSLRETDGYRPGPLSQLETWMLEFHDLLRARIPEVNLAAAPARFA